MVEDQHKFVSGFVAFVGRPNAGKSTLTNALVGSKIAITSSTPQTTRHRLRAIINRPNSQIIVVDTPGLHKPHDALGEEVNQSTFKALEDVDVVAFLIDGAQKFGKGDQWVVDFIKKTRGLSGRIGVITKSDTTTPEQIEAQIKALEDLEAFDGIIVVSAVEGFNLEGLLSEVEKFLPEGPMWFPADMQTDQPLEVMIAEFIREKALNMTFDEVPHAVGVVVDDLQIDEKTNLARIFATIFVERVSQKGIIIGKQGSVIKEIGSHARTDLQKLLNMRVHLDLRVKVKKGWRKDASQIKRFGYGEGL